MNWGPRRWPITHSAGRRPVLRAFDSARHFGGAESTVVRHARAPLSPPPLLPRQDLSCPLPERSQLPPSFRCSVSLPRRRAVRGFRRPIPQDAYGQWKSIASPVLSNDGRWAIYTLTPEVGEGTFVARSTSGSTEYRHDRGFVARPNLVPSGRGGFTQTPAAITPDSRWATFTIDPPRDAVESARRSKRRPN